MSSFKRRASQIIHRISQISPLRRMSVSSTVRAYRKRSSTDSFFRMFKSTSNEAKDPSGTAAAMSSMPSPTAGNQLAAEAPPDIWAPPPHSTVSRRLDGDIKS
ncbi:tRNA (guanine(37)-N1)-methyltransferase [Venturia inaequalis]|nr:tRNA (guanine(37)-N1)-methyltransferase [Venturia inaequalis]